MGHDSGGTWIERGSDGRYMFVRKRTRPPSTQSVLANAFSISNNPFRRSPSRTQSRPRSRPPSPHSHSFSRAESKDLIKTQAPPPTSSVQLALPAPYHNTVLPAEIKMNPGAANGQPWAHAGGQYSEPYSLNDPHQASAYPPYPSYGAPYPAYYLAPIPTPPVFPDPYLPMPLPPPLGARIPSPPRQSTTDELKYKCSICGRFRSPRFHFRHPIPPGHLPARTVCRKCRQTGTDSEDTSDDQVRPRRVGQRRSVSVSQPTRTPTFSDDHGGRLGRRPSREFPVFRSRSRRRGRLRRRSVSPSSSLEPDEAGAIEEHHHPRPRSRSVRKMVERVRYYDDEDDDDESIPHDTARVEKVESWRMGRTVPDEQAYDTDHDSDDAYVPSRHVVPCPSDASYANRLTHCRRAVSRAASGIRISREKQTEPLIKEHVRITPNEYLGDRNRISTGSTVIDDRPYPPSRVRPTLHILRVSSDEARRVKDYLARSDEYELVADRPVPSPGTHEDDWSEDQSRQARRERRRQKRSRSRVPSGGDLDHGEAQAPLMWGRPALRASKLTTDRLH